MRVESNVHFSPLSCLLSSLLEGFSISEYSEVVCHRNILTYPESCRIIRWVILVLESSHVCPCTIPIIKHLQIPASTPARSWWVLHLELKDEYVIIVVPPSP
jgi:hypothetical protein